MTVIFILVAVVYLFDGGQGYLQGPIRAMGLQHKASLYAIACYWIIGVPLAIMFGFWKDFGCFGLYAGIAVAVLFQFISYLIILIR